MFFFIFDVPCSFYSQPSIATSFAMFLPCNIIASDSCFNGLYTIDLYALRNSLLVREHFNLFFYMPLVRMNNCILFLSSKSNCILIFFYGVNCILMFIKYTLILVGIFNPSMHTHCIWIRRKIRWKIIALGSSHQISIDST